MTLTRAEFEAVTKTTLDRCKEPIKQVIGDSAFNPRTQKPSKPADIDHVILVGGATRMPAVAHLVEDLTIRKPYRGLIPEGIVTGATLQAGVLSGAVKDILLLDVIPLSLGIEIQRGLCTKLIERNTSIPTKRAEIFTTAKDDQQSVTIRVVEGEREIADYNSILAVFELTGLAPEPKEAPRSVIHKLLFFILSLSRFQVRPCTYPQIGL